MADREHLHHGRVSPPERREAPAANRGPNSVDVVDDLRIVSALAANRAALRRRLERIAREADRRGDADTAAVSRYFLDAAS